MTSSCQRRNYPANKYMLKSTIETLKKHEIYSKIIIVKTPKRRKWHRPGIFIFNLKPILQLSSISIVGFEQVNACWLRATT